MLPKLDGLEVCKRLRAESTVPIIMLTARDDELDKVLGLELGADDYITKPFSIREFRSRVRALLRRAAAPRPGERRDDEVIEAGELTIDIPRRTVEVRGAEGAADVRRVRAPARARSCPGRVFSRRQLLEAAARRRRLSRAAHIDVHVRHLREKIEDTRTAEADPHGARRRLPLPGALMVRRPRLRGIRLRLALALFVVVAWLARPSST